MNIYKERLLDHYRHPRYKGLIENSDITSGVHNPSCGDAITVTGTVKDGIIVDIAFDGFGCVISQASASMLMEAVRQKPLTYANAFTKESMIELVGFDCGPTRLKCVLIAWEALRGALHAQST